MKKPEKTCDNCRYVGTRDQMAFVPPNFDVYRPVLVMVCKIDPKDVSPSHTCSDWQEWERRRKSCDLLNRFQRTQRG